MEEKNIKVAMPVAQGRLCMHFGHCDQFAVYEVDNGKVKSESVFTPPAHTPGAYPNWLSSMGVKVVLVGGIGAKAVEIFTQNNIEVIKGLEAESMMELIEKYIAGGLVSGDNTCNHGTDHHQHHHNCAH